MEREEKLALARKKLEKFQNKKKEEVIPKHDEQPAIMQLIPDDLSSPTTESLPQKSNPQNNLIPQGFTKSFFGGFMNAVSSIVDTINQPEQLDKPHSKDGFEDQPLYYKENTNQISQDPAHSHGQYYSNTEPYYQESQLYNYGQPPVNTYYSNNNNNTNYSNSNPPYSAENYESFSTFAPINNYSNYNPEYNQQVLPNYHQQDRNSYHQQDQTNYHQQDQHSYLPQDHANYQQHSATYQQDQANYPEQEQIKYQSQLETNYRTENKNQSDYISEASNYHKQSPFMIVDQTPFYPSTQLEKTYQQEDPIKYQSQTETNYQTDHKNQSDYLAESSNYPKQSPFMNSDQTPFKPTGQLETPYPDASNHTDKTFTSYKLDSSLPNSYDSASTNQNESSSSNWYSNWNKTVDGITNNHPSHQTNELVITNPSPPKSTSPSLVNVIDTPELINENNENDIHRFSSPLSDQSFKANGSPVMDYSYRSSSPEQSVIKDYSFRKLSSPPKDQTFQNKEYIPLSSPPKDQTFQNKEYIPLSSPPKEQTFQNNDYLSEVASLPHSVPSSSSFYNVPGEAMIKDREQDTISMKSSNSILNPSIKSPIIPIQNPVLSTVFEFNNPIVPDYKTQLNNKQINEEINQDYQNKVYALENREKEISEREKAIENQIKKLELDQITFQLQSSTLIGNSHSLKTDLEKEKQLLNDKYKAIKDKESQLEREKFLIHEKETIIKQKERDFEVTSQSIKERLRVLEEKERGIEGTFQSIKEKQRQLEDIEFQLKSKEIQLNDSQSQLLSRETTLKIEQEKSTRNQKDIENRHSEFIVKEQGVERMRMKLEETETRVMNDKLKIDEIKQGIESKKVFIENEEKRINQIQQKNNGLRKELSEKEAELLQKKAYLDHKEASIIQMNEQIKQRIEKLSEKEKEIGYKSTQIENETKKLSVLGSELNKFHQQVMNENQILQQIKPEIESKEKELIQREYELSLKTQNADEKLVQIQQKHEYCQRIESEIISKQADIRKQNEVFEHEKSSFDTLRTKNEQERHYLENRSIMIESALKELNEKQQSIHQEQKRLQSLANIIEKDRLDIERDRSEVLERESECRKRMELSVQSISERDRITIIDQQISFDRQNIEKERRDLLQKRLYIKSQEDDFSMRVQKFRDEQAKIGELVRKVELNQKTLHTKEMNNRRVQDDFIKKQQDFESAIQLFESDKQKFLVERSSLDASFTDLKEQRRKLQQLLEMKNQGSELESLRGLLQEEYMTLIRNNEMSHRRIQDESLKRIRELEDDIFVLKRKNSYDDGQHLRTETQASTYSHLSQDQIRKIGEQAINQLNGQSRHVNGNIHYPDKEKNDLLNVIVALSKQSVGPSRNGSVYNEGSVRSHQHESSSIRNYQHAPIKPDPSFKNYTNERGYQTRPGPLSVIESSYTGDPQEDLEILKSMRQSSPHRMNYEPSIPDHVSDINRTESIRGREGFRYQDPKLVVAALREKADRNRVNAYGDRLSRVKTPLLRETRGQNDLKSYGDKPFISKQDLDGLSQETRSHLSHYMDSLI